MSDFAHSGIVLSFLSQDLGVSSLLLFEGMFLDYIFSSDILESLHDRSLPEVFLNCRKVSIVS